MVKLGPTVNEFEASKQEGGKVIKFEDVKGVDEAKDELREIVEFRTSLSPSPYKDTFSPTFLKLS